MEKTIDLVMEDLKLNIAQNINESNIPPYLVLMLLNELSMECKSIADSQLNQNREKYNQSLQEKSEEK